MMVNPQVKQYVENLALPTSVDAACRSVFNAIESVNEDEAKFLTLDFFAEQLPRETSFEHLMAALNLLSSMPSPLLRIHGYLWLNDTPVILEDEDFRHVVRSGELVHPESGELIADGHKLVSLFYSVGDR